MDENIYEKAAAALNRAKERVTERPGSGQIGAQSKATTQNPKDLFGSLKVSLTKLPAVAVAHAAHAMMDGAEKYGPYNWRDKAVLAGIYCDAAKRHIDAWFEGELNAKDSGAHHLGHAIACCAILLDAESQGALIDDRPKNLRANALASTHALISEKIQYRRKEKEQKRVDQSWAEAAAIDRLESELGAGAKPRGWSGDAAAADKGKEKPYYYRRQFDNTFTVFSPEGFSIVSLTDEDQAAKKCRELDMRLAAGKAASKQHFYTPMPDGRFRITDPNGTHLAFVHKHETAEFCCRELNAGTFTFK